MTSDSASRVTRSRWHLLGAVALLAVVGVLRAQEPQAPASPPPASAPAPAANPPATNPPAANPPASTAPAAGAPPAAKSGRTQDRFEPTEKVRADFDVSFPIDI
jgi:hypothetical protein